MPKTTLKPFKGYLYRAKDGGWTGHIIARNGQDIFKLEQSLKQRTYAVRRLRRQADGAPIYERTGEPPKYKNVLVAED